MTAFTGDTPEFIEWPKIARLNRRVIVTEKIDGTNAAIIVTPDGRVWAQSRKRIIEPGKDNFGFASWVAERAPVLAEILGEGYHYGEWYGSGIQRGYGLDEKRFMLFNTERWGKEETRELLRGRSGIEVATVLYDGPFAAVVHYHLNDGPELEQPLSPVNAAVEDLRLNGSRHVPGFDKPEGVVAFHPAGNLAFKVTVDKDESPKGAKNG